MNKLLLSLIIPVYNKEKYLPDCLNSIPEALCDRMEIILVDDGSSDRSGEMCDFYAKAHERVAVIHQENRGSAAARSRGTEEACGEYLLFCDADDYYEKGALLEISGLLEKYAPDILLFNAYETGIRAEKKKFSPALFEEGFIQDKSRVYDLFLLTYYLNSMCVKACKRELFLRNPAEEAFRGNLGDDFLESAPLFKRAQTIYYTDRPFYDYRIDSGMMRKAHREYYSQYRRVNMEVREILKEEGIPGLDGKLAVHLLNAAYGAVIQYRYEKKTDREAINEISDDRAFRDAFELVKKDISRYLNRKQRTVIYCVYGKRLLLIRLLVSARRRLDLLQGKYISR